MAVSMSQRHDEDDSAAGFRSAPGPAELEALTASDRPALPRRLWDKDSSGNYLPLSSAGQAGVDPLRPAGDITPVEAQPTQRAPKERGPFSLPESAFDPDLLTIDVDQPRSHPLIWLAMGLVGAVVGQAAGLYFFHRNQAFNGSLLFTLCALAPYIFPAFQRHAQEVWSGRSRPRRANIRMAFELVALFLGLVLGYLIVPLAMGVGFYVQTMEGARDFIDFRLLGLANLEFADFPAILIHNIRVFLVFLLIGLVFRYLGILFVVVYNAAIWGVIFAAATAGSIGSADGSPLLALLQMVVTVGPHLSLEVSAYVVAAMCGIFLNRIVWRYRLLSPKLEGITSGILRFCAVGLVLITVGAVFESFYAQWSWSLFYEELQARP